MTLQTYWIYNQEKQLESNDPIIIKWIEKLGLSREKIIINHESNEGYQAITLHYDHRIASWVIGLPIGFEIEHALHKLGYIWYYKKCYIIDTIKKNWIKRDKILVLAESCILDNLVFYQFSKMDLDFKQFLLKFILNDLKYFYNGASWYKDLPNMIYRYIVNYLTYNFVLDQEPKNEWSNYIMYNLIMRRNEILEKAEMLNISYSKNDFRRLHKLLRLFENIKNTDNYSKIMHLIRQVYFYFPLV